MMKYSILFFLLAQIIYAQTDSLEISRSKHDDYVNQLKIDDQTKIRNFMKLSDYRRIYKNKGIKISLDTIGYMIPSKDTLVILNSSKDKNVINVSRPFEYRDSTFIALYKKVAFSEGSRGKENKIKKLLYWKSDIKLFFTNAISKKSKLSLLNFAKNISKDIDSLKIYEVKDIKDCNFIVYGENDYNYCESLLNSQADLYVSWSGKNIIQKGFIKINKGYYFNEKLFNLKLNELFLQSIGFFTFTNAIACENYFSNCFSENKQVSAIDIALLKYHYSYGICKGIDEDTFDQLHKNSKEAKKNARGRNAYNIIHLVDKK